MVMQLAESCAASSEAGHAASSESQPFARSRAAIIWQKKEEKEKEEHSALPPKLAGLAASSSAGCTQAVTPSSRHSSRLSSRRSVPPLRSACKMTDESLRPRRRPWARPGQRSAALSRRRSLRAHPVSRPRPPASHPRPSRRGRGLRAPRRRSHRLRAPPP